MLSLRTEVDRLLLCVVLVPLCLIAFGLEFLLFGAATLEFKHAAWVENVGYPPALSTSYGRWFPCGWVIPTVVLAWSLLLARKPTCQLGSLALLGAVSILGLVAQAALAMLAFYLANQSFVSSP